jgi:hypothetical protein
MFVTVLLLPTGTVTTLWESDILTESMSLYIAVELFRTRICGQYYSSKMGQFTFEGDLVAAWVYQPEILIWSRLEEAFLLACWNPFKFAILGNNCDGRKVDPLVREGSRLHRCIPISPLSWRVPNDSRGSQRSLNKRSDRFVDAAQGA